PPPPPPFSQVFGKGGAYRCIFVEERSMSAAEFEGSVRKSGAASPPARSRGSKVDDAFMERPFWSSVTINPPLYGADTPLSLFDRKLAYGWNLRQLDCLLSEYDVPDIPGVTSPMTYFGSWKSFFGWHKEDIDLYSINFLHAGEAKIWYCISPSDAAKFEALARGLFPDLHARCPAFMRHKDIMISPKLLRAHAVPFVQARQEPGEFVVLNAAAYHSGYNMGFNIAEAVNFALPEWLRAGRDAVNC
ncbi:JmjC domain-containing hydroxylase, partial [Helicosporidium sp. ATCC 50920]